MISGRSSGSGKYSYQETSYMNASVLVSHTPEENHVVRIIFRSHGEESRPIIKMDTIQAELLWASLNRMAKDLGFEDRMIGETEKDAKK